MCIIDWLNNNNGFVMAILTAVYVFATIKMMHQTSAANKIAKNGINLSRNQFSENLRLSHLPVLTIQCCDNDIDIGQQVISEYRNCASEETNCTECRVFFKIANIGNGLATKISYNINFDTETDDSLECDRESSIVRGESIYKAFDFIVKDCSGDLAENADETCTDKTYCNEAIIKIYFLDIIGNCYMKKVDLVIYTTYDSNGTLKQSVVNILWSDNDIRVDTPDALLGI